MEQQNYLNPFDKESTTTIYHGQDDERINRALIDAKAILGSDTMRALMDQVRDEEPVRNAVTFLTVGGFMKAVCLSDGTLALVPSTEWLIDIKEQGAR